MYTLQKLNVVKIVDNENDKSQLLAKGFIEVTEEPKKTTKK